MLTHFWILSDKSTIWFYSTKKFEDLYVCQIGINNLWVNITEKKNSGTQPLFLPGKKMIEQMVCSETAAFGKKLVCKAEYILQPTKMWKFLSLGSFHC